MMTQPTLQIAMRYIHILSAIALVGGVLYQMLVRRVASEMLQGEGLESFLQVLRKKISSLQWIAVAGLLVTGFYQWMSYASLYKQAGPGANAMLGIKVLLALLVFMVMWMRQSNILKSDKQVMMINSHLAAVIILLAAILRYYRLSAG